MHPLALLVFGLLRNDPERPLDESRFNGLVTRLLRSLPGDGANPDEDF